MPEEPKQPKQQSVPKFTEPEQAIIDVAMKVSEFKTQGAFVRWAALMYAKQLIAQDGGAEELVRERVQAKPVE